MCSALGNNFLQEVRQQLSSIITNFGQKHLNSASSITRIRPDQIHKKGTLLALNKARNARTDDQCPWFFHAWCINRDLMGRLKISSIILVFRQHLLWQTLSASQIANAVCRNSWPMYLFPWTGNLWETKLWKVERKMLTSLSSIWYKIRTKLESVPSPKVFKDLPHPAVST